MRVIVTGAGGQLGRSLGQILHNHELILTTRTTLDISQECSVGKLAALRPELVIHAAAATDVDRCETDPATAWLVNAEGTRRVAIACLECGAEMLYISTDYVFDGNKGEAYLETDPPNPINTYGRTKLAGEEFVQHYIKRFYVVRTAWLYGKGGKSFVSKVLDLAHEPPLRIVASQFGSPTWTDDLARAIGKLMHTGAYGIYHLANEGRCSRYEMAKAILEAAKLPHVEVEPIAWYDRPAPIPLDTTLKNTRAAQYGITLPPWRLALSSFLRTLSVT